MDPCLASYEYHFQSAHWLYQLYPNRVVATGHTGNQNFEQVFLLGRYFEHPNRATRFNTTKRPALAWLAAAMTVLIGVIAVAAAGAALSDGAIVGIIGGSVGVGAAVFFLTLHRGALKVLVTSIHFKQHDNKDSFFIWQIGDEKKEEFAAFVEKIQSLIRGLHQ